MSEDLIKFKKLIVDLDNTITITENGKYGESKPFSETIDRLKEYYSPQKNPLNFLTTPLMDCDLI